MKWAGHIILTFGSAYILSEDIYFSLLVSAGSILPDKLEGCPPDSSRDYEGYWKWRSAHRGVTHWFVVYLLVAFLVYIYSRFYAADQVDYKLCTAALCLCMGALCHILQDACCGKVPVTGLKRRDKKGVKLFKVGGIGEIFFGVACLAAVYYLKGYLAGYLAAAGVSAVGRL